MGYALQYGMCSMHITERHEGTPVVSIGPSPLFLAVTTDWLTDMLSLTA
jgi:hypothetical protein